MPLSLPKKKFFWNYTCFSESDPLSKQQSLAMRHGFLVYILILGSLLHSHAANASNPQNPLLTTNSVFLSKQGIYKFNRHSLEPIWTSLQGVQTYEPVMGAGLLFVGSTEGLFALSPDSGEVVWHIEPEQTIFSPVVADQIFAGSLHGELYSINTNDGAIKWRRQFEGWVYSPVVLPRLRQLWTGGQAHQASLLDSSNGDLLKRVELDQEIVFSPQKLDEENIIFNLFSGDSVIIDTRSSTMVGRLEGESQPRHISINKNIIYRTNRDGSLIAFDKISHKTIWHHNLVASDLSMHPVNQGYMLLSDLDRIMVLINLQSQDEIFRTRIDGAWFSPVQIDENHIVYFRNENMQPNQIRAVKLDARDT